MEQTEQQLLGLNTPLKKVLSFGELLLRICPDEDGEWLQQSQLPFYVGGSEANVAAALARWSVPVAYLSRVPDNAMLRQIVNHLDQLGIDISKLQYGGPRLGLYFLSKGKDLKHATVIYDRLPSSFSELKPGMIDWDAVLHDVSWLHFSAISPGLAPNLVDVCAEAAAAAAARGLVLSLDLNYRAKLWQWGQPPHAVMPQLVAQCNVLMGNIWAAEKMLQSPLDAEGLQLASKQNYIDAAQKVSEELCKRFPKLKMIANTFRFDQSAMLHYYATLYAGGQLYVSAEHEVSAVVDNVGTGDCFMAGLIYGCYQNQPLQRVLDFAAAAAVKKLGQSGDMTTTTVAEIEKLIPEHAR